MLFEAWVQLLSKERLQISQHGSGSSDKRPPATFGSPVEHHFTLGGSGLDVVLEEAVDVDVEAIDPILKDAIAKVAAHDYGSPVVYQTTMNIAPLDFMAGAMHFMRVLGDQVRIQGQRRLSDAVLLNFEETLDEVPEGGLLLAPATKVTVSIFAPGPCHSTLSRR